MASLLTYLVHPEADPPPRPHHPRPADNVWIRPFRVLGRRAPRAAGPVDGAWRPCCAARQTGTAGQSTQPVSRRRWSIGAGLAFPRKINIQLRILSAYPQQVCQHCPVAHKHPFLPLRRCMFQPACMERRNVAILYTNRIENRPKIIRFGLWSVLTVYFFVGTPLQPSNEHIRRS